MHDAFAVGHKEFILLLRAKSFLVKVDGLGGIGYDEVWSNGVESIWNWFCHNFFLSLVDLKNFARSEKISSESFVNFFEGVPNK